MAELKEVLYEATREAGKIIKSYFEGVFTVESKDRINDLVTEVDKLSEKRIIEVIKEHFPSHSIISEEVGELKKDSPYQWIIDPIDGTVNFAHSIPICCVSIAIKYYDDLLLGAVYNPIMNEFFFAEKGKGATLNDKPISVSKKTDFQKACLVTGFPYRWAYDAQHPIKVFEKFVLEGLPVRRLGSAAIDLCWVACGRFDGFWEYNLSSWDLAAGYLIVQEAGGRITNFDGKAYSVFDKETLATNGLIHEAMLTLIRQTEDLNK